MRLVHQEYVLDSKKVAHVNTLLYMNFYQQAGTMQRGLEGGPVAFTAPIPLCIDFGPEVCVCTRKGARELHRNKGVAEILYT